MRIDVLNPIKDAFEIFKTKSDDFFISFRNPFGLYTPEANFINYKLKSLYVRILSDCFTKSEGWRNETKEEKETRVSNRIQTPEEKIIASLWDNFATDTDQEGLIALVADAMVAMKQLCIVYETDTGLVRKATTEEKKKIEEGYKAGTKPVALGNATGILVNFKNYTRTLILKLYLALLYAALAASYTNLKIGQALKLKISKLREAVSKMTSTDIIKQGKKITDALKLGQSVMLDKEDELEVNDSTNDGAVKNLMTIFYSEIAAELGVSLSYVNATLTTGMNVNGEADANYNENGIKNFFDSIFKPVCDSLYGVKLAFISDKRFYRVLENYGALIAIENSALLPDSFKETFVGWLTGEKVKLDLVEDIAEEEEVESI